MNNNKKLAINGGDPVRKNLLPILIPSINDLDVKYVCDALKSTYVTGDGPKCREFEKKISEYINTKHVFYTTSCTAALDLAFMIKDFPKGSEVIVPNFTYTSSALAPLMNNLKIVLVDVDSRNGNINFKKIEEKINKKTVAIIPVDYAGVPADLDEINIISKKHGLYVVHDAAQSFGSKYKNKVIGSQAEVTCFSFHGTKNLTTGEGGAIATNSDLLAEKIAICREKGTDKHLFLTHKKTKGYYEFISKGNSYVQSNLLGAMGISQLERIDEMNDKRKRIAQKLIESLKDIPEIEFPYIPEYCVSNWHLFNILVSPEKKNWIIDALISEGIHANIHYKPLHMNQYYSDLGKDTDFPGSVQFYNRLVRLPMYPSLQNDEVEDVITALKKVLKNI